MSNISVLFFFFMHNPCYFYRYIKMHCRLHFAEMLSFIDVPLANNNAACIILCSIALKAHVLKDSKQEKSSGCI